VERSIVRRVLKYGTLALILAASAYALWPPPEERGRSGGAATRRTAKL